MSALRFDFNFRHAASAQDTMLSLPLFANAWTTKENCFLPPVMPEFEKLREKVTWNE
jgi:hypothetical protein